MAIRTISQVLAGAVAGAVLVGVPTWAVASQQGGDSVSRTDMSQKMSGPQAQDQMMRSMSKMMNEPKMRKEMASMMSDAMAQMPDMRGKMSSRGMSGMGQMHGMGKGSTSGPAPKK